MVYFLVFGVIMHANRGQPTGTYIPFLVTGVFVWTFTWTRDVVHQAVTRLVTELSPVAVVLGAPRRARVPMRPSLARWLIGRPNVQAVVVPA